MSDKNGVFDPVTSGEIFDLLGEDRYHASLKEAVDELDSLVRNFDTLDEAAQISEIHKSSGVCAMLGVAGVHERLLQIEIAGKEGKSEAYQQYWMAFLEDWRQMREEILEFIG